MHKAMLVVTTTVAAMAFITGTASAQSNLVEVANPGNFTLEGEVHHKIKHPSTGVTHYAVTCQVTADAALNVSGHLDIYNWAPEDDEGWGPEHCDDNLSAWDDCSNSGEYLDTGFLGDIVPPGTEWSVGSGFSLYFPEPMCFYVQAAGPAYGFDPLTLIELSTDQLHWTSEETQFGWVNGWKAFIEVDLTADRYLGISEIEE